MKQLRYLGQTWLVGDTTAEILLDHAAALARAGLAEHISLRVLDVNGTAEQIEFLIGPATMMTAEPATAEFADPDNADMERTMQSRTGELDAAATP